MEIKAAIRKQINHGRYEPDYFFGDGKSGKKVAEILARHAVKIQKLFNPARNFYLIKNLIN